MTLALLEVSNQLWRQLRDAHPLLKHIECPLARIVGNSMAVEFRVMVPSHPKLIRKLTGLGWMPLHHATSKKPICMVKVMALD